MTELYRKIFKLTVTALLFCLSTVSFSQSKDAGAILEKTTKKYNEYTGGMEIGFTANVRSVKNNINESFEGTLTMKENKFALNTPDVKNWFNGTTLWTYMTNIQEVNVSNPAGNELQSINPLLFLRNYKKDFNVSYIGESTSHNNKMAYDIVMTPKKKDDIEKIELQIEKSTSLPSRIVMLMKNDIRNSIIVKEVKSVDIPDTKFAFPEKDFPGVELVDLR
jgi:outer membrane lipoprotein-sorting protein